MWLSVILAVYALGCPAIAFLRVRAAAPRVTRRAWYATLIDTLTLTIIPVAVLAPLAYAVTR